MNILEFISLKEQEMIELRERDPSVTSVIISESLLCVITQVITKIKETTMTQREGRNGIQMELTDAQPLSHFIRKYVCLLPLITIPCNKMTRYLNLALWSLINDLN